MFGTPLSIVTFVLFFLFVPGLPLAYFVARRSGLWSLLFCLSPVFSVGISFSTVSLLNLVGLRPPLEALGRVIALLTISAFAIWVRPTMREVRLIAKELAIVTPAVIIGVFIWLKAYEGFLFLAPNQDALNHNKWIARIVQVDSFLPRDSYVGSPLQPVGQGTGFYPLAWHSQVATAVQISDLVIPAASLLSLVVVWTVCLPSSLRALSKVWVPELSVLGVVAGVLSQAYPLTPGVPLSWGSMTSVVGIGLLPAVFSLGVVALRKRDSRLLASFLGAACTLFFIHTPEAASLAVLMVVTLIFDQSAVTRQKLKTALLLAFVFVAPLVLVFRDLIWNDITSLRALFGAPQPVWEIALGQFFALNVNIPSTYGVLALLFIIGLAFAAQEKRQRWLIAAVLCLGLVYLIAGASTGPLATIRFLTAPWYASYERTAWIIVPFAALVSAYPIASLMNLTKQRSVVRVFGAQVFAVALFAHTMGEQIPATISQLRSGPEVAALIGTRDLQVIDLIRERVSDGEMALSWMVDGSTYPFMYRLIPMSAGAPLDRYGNLSKSIQKIYDNITRLCDNPDAMTALKSEKVKAVVFGTTTAWGLPIWTVSEVRALRGLRVLAVGEKLIATEPDAASCQ